MSVGVRSCVTANWWSWEDLPSPVFRFFVAWSPINCEPKAGDGLIALPTWEEKGRYVFFGAAIVPD